MPRIKHTAKPSRSRDREEVITKKTRNLDITKTRSAQRKPFKRHVLYGTFLRTKRAQKLSSFHYLKRAHVRSAIKEALLTLSRDSQVNRDEYRMTRKTEAVITDLLEAQLEQVISAGVLVMYNQNKRTLRPRHIITAMYAKLKLEQGPDAAPPSWFRDFM